MSTIVAAANCCHPHRDGRPLALLIAGVIGLSGCGQPAASQSTASTASADERLTDEEHGHKSGAHGGFIVPIGKDHYHAEAVFHRDGTLAIYLLGNDESEVLETESQPLACYVRPTDSKDSAELVLNADPQPGDSPGRTSRFTGRLPDDLAAQEVFCLVPSVRIGPGRYRFSFTSQLEQPDMPVKVVDDAERSLYLTPGGHYTVADIDANGRVTASERYLGFHSAHDFDPQPGDRLCPITRTKANPACTWVIGGRTYQFCCPPCIDEFVRRAKERPGQLEPPEALVQQ